MSEDDFSNMVETVAGEHGEMLEDGAPYNGWCFSCEELIEFSHGIIRGWGWERRAQEYALAARQPVGEPVTVEAMATVRRTSDGDRYIDWLTEGGIADLEVGDVLMVSDRAITDEDGSGEVYTAPPALALDLARAKVQIAAMELQLAVCEQPAQDVDLGSGVKAIADERERQLQAEGFSRDCDQQYREGELARAATAYTQLAAMDLQVGTRSHIDLQEPPFFWPWAPEWWKPVDARRDLVRAGALIAAQIDLIDGKAVSNG